MIVSSIITTTRTGLRVRAEPGLGSYPTGAKVSDEQAAALPQQQVSPSQPPSKQRVDTLRVLFVRDQPLIAHLGASLGAPGAGSS